MSILDIFLNGLAWYRRKRGGVWYYVREDSGIGPAGSSYYWTRDPDEDADIIKTENPS